MDVREAVTILRRRWWLVVGLPVAVGVLGALTGGAPPTIYEARLRFAIDIPESAIVEGSDEGTAAKIGEALIDDIARIIPSQAFAEAVAARLPEGAGVAPGQIASDLSATDRHRTADVWVRRTLAPGASAPDAEALRQALAATADAVVAELEQNGNTWFARLGEDDVALTVIDRPAVTVVPPTLRTRLDLPMRVALALVVAVGLAFLLHALDPKLYTTGEAAEATGAAILGHIPRRARSRWLR